MPAADDPGLDRLPAALRRVPRTATQPLSPQLLSYDQVMTRLAELSPLPRVRVELAGSSRAGRAVPFVAITSPAGVQRLDQIRATAARLAAPQIRHQTAITSEVLRPQLDQPPPDFRLPILFQSSNFGMEAAQVEALIELTEFFATDSSADTLAVLDRLVILIVPLINPDGRQLALAHWDTRPLSPAWCAQGNLHGVEVTREYLHQTDPESQALSYVARRWHPFLVWEVHEDGIGLGWGHPQTCLCPPIAPAGQIGIDSPVAASINDPRLYAEYQRYGAAIASAWAERGYDYLYDPQGRHGWPRYPVAGYEDLVPPPETRFTQAMQLRGVPAFITESCRVPGSQTWQDRVGQKVSAGIAVAATAAGAADPLVQVVSGVQREASQGSGSRPGEEFYLLPADQDPYPLARAVAILRAHEIGVYQAGPDVPEPALVVPAAQPLRPTIDLLLAADQGRHQSLGPAIGLRVRPSSALSAGERAAWEQLALRPVNGAAGIRPQHSAHGEHGELASDSCYQVANSHHGVTLVSRLLRIPGTQVWWDTSALHRAGRFVFSAGPQPEAAGQAASGLAVSISECPRPEPGELVSLRAPRVGIYQGQGQLENRFNGSLLSWFLSDWEFPFRLVGPGDFTAGVLAGLDFLAVPAGDAAAMLTGSGPDTVWHRYPWDLDEDPVTVPPESAGALRAWLRAGGTYAGIDAGGGLLATTEFLGLVDASRENGNLGTGLVELSVDQSGDPLFSGLGGSWGPDGSWRDGVIYAMYGSYPRGGLDGGCVFAARGEAKVLARFARPLRVGDIPHIRTAESFRTPHPDRTVPDSTVPHSSAADSTAHGAAIVGQQVGQGYAAIFGIEPTYRATFSSSARLISNLIFSSVSRPRAAA